MFCPILSDKVTVKVLFCLGTLKSAEEVDVEHSEYRYLLQNLGVLESNINTKNCSIKEDSSGSLNDFTDGKDNNTNTLGARIRKISQPLMKKKSTATLLNDFSPDPYLLPSNDHLLHTLNQKTPLLMDEGTPVKRKITLTTLLENKIEEGIRE